MQHLDETLPVPSPLLLNSNGVSAPNLAYTRWILIDQNLTAALCSTVTSVLLPYVLHLDSCPDIWLRKLLKDFQIQLNTPTDIHCDNESAIALANNPMFHARTKHINIDHHFIRDHISANTIRVLPISSQDQIADVLTKPLSAPRFHSLRLKLTVQQPPSACEGVIMKPNICREVKQSSASKD